MKRHKISLTTTSEVLRYGNLPQISGSEPLRWMCLPERLASEVLHRAWKALRRGAEAVDRDFYPVNEVKDPAAGHDTTGVR